MNARTFLHAVSMETRTLLSYRFDFWVNFLFGVGTFVVANQVLWQAVYRSRGVESIGGYSLPDMVLYVLVTGCLTRVTFGNLRGAISQDIYSGGLNKYLVFPVSFHAFKYAAHMAFGLVALAQLVLAVGAGYFLLGPEPFARVEAPSFALGMLLSLAGGYVYFCLNAILDQVAFWAENVWSLGVMLRFAALFFGGGLAPLALFPESAQAVLRFLPFPYIVYLPARCLQGAVTAEELATGVPVLLGWALLATLAMRLVYRSGLKTYSGVGI